MSRVYVIVYLFGGLAVMVWLSSVLARLSSEGRRIAVVAALSAVVAYEQTGFTPDSYSRDDYTAEVDRLAAQLRGAELGYIIPRAQPYPDKESDTYGDVVAMWVGMKANVPVVNGYSGRSPPGFGVQPTDLDATLRAWLTGKFRGTVTIIDPHRTGEVRRLVIE